MKAAPLVLSVLVVTGPGFAQDIPVQMPAGAQLVLHTEDAFARVTFPVGSASNGDVPQDKQEGTVRTSVIQFPTEMSLDALMVNLRSQLVGEDQVVLLDCTSRTCGGFDFREAVETIPPPEMIVDLALFGYLAVRNGISGQVDFALLSLAGGTGYLQHVSVTPAPAPVIEMPSATESTEALETPTKEEGLFAGRGTIVLEGLEFETGSAALSDADYPGLRELAAFLASNPDATVILVGHTDAEGNLEPNITLSRQRAEAVRTRLINGFGVPPAQLLADGVGYLAPRATNTTQEGRLRNRRVEAVLMAR